MIRSGLGLVYFNIMVFWHVRFTLGMQRFDHMDISSFNQATDVRIFLYYTWDKMLISVRYIFIYEVLLMPP